MNIFPIRNNESLNRALKRMDELWNAECDTPEGDELDIWMVLVEDYEAKKHPYPPRPCHNGSSYIHGPPMED